MRTKFFAIAALVLGLASCAKDFAPEANFGGEVDFTLAVSAPELAATRAGEYGENDGVNGHNSAYGAIDYLSDAEWDKVDLRYTLEVYDVADDYTNAKPIKDRQVKFVDKYEGVTFETRLAPNRNYRFVVFADFVEEEKVTNDPAIEAQRTIGMRHDIGDNLTQITIKEDAINDEYADAYFGTLDFNPTNNVANKVEKPMILTRPYAKMRVVATDLADLNINVDPAYVKVVYNAYHPGAFNAVNGDISGEYKQKDLTYECNYTEKYGNISKLNLSNYLYTNGYEEKTTTNADGVVRHTHMTLFTDYILAEDAQSSIQFTMTVFEDEAMNNPIKETAFNTEIPVQRNHLTTIIGNVLTTATEVKVTIDDNFANADHQNWVFDAFVNGGEVTLDQNYTIGSTLYVESGVEAVLNLNGYSIKNTKSNQLTDVIVVKEGGKLTINGNGTIEAVDGNDGYAVICEGELVINGGTYKSGRDENKASNAIIYARGNGKVYINDGIFNTPGSWNDGSFVLNKKDSDRATTVIEVRGGKFNRFNPYDNAAEGPETNFCADGLWAIEEGNYFVVVPLVHYNLYADHAEVYSAQGLLKWAYIVNNGATAELQALLGDNAANFDRKAYGLKLMANIKLPARVIATEGESYVYTDEVITLDSEKRPSGSNWYVVSPYPSAAPYVYYTGTIDGNGKTISGLRMAGGDLVYGFVGCMHKGAVVKNITFKDARVHATGGTYAAIVVAWNCDGATTDGVKLVNSSIYDSCPASNTNHAAGGIVGQNQRRIGSAYNYNEEMAYVLNCSTDADCSVYCANKGNVGGICGYNYGATIYNCVNAADVAGSSNVGGVVGHHRDYVSAVDGYVLACKSTADATISAVSNASTIGGIAGYQWADGSASSAWIVACVSESELVKGGAISGVAKETAKIVGSWAVKNGVSILANKDDLAQERGSFIYNKASEATQADVDAMNAEIEVYNASAVEDEHFPLSLRWVLTANGPVLQ